MPKATVSLDTLRKDLTTVPGGWVELKTLSFDQMLERRDNAMKMSQEIQTGNQARARVDLQLANKWATHFEFKHCIVDHNLTDDNEQPLDFKNPRTLEILDPKVGQEIQRYLDDLNKEDEEDLADFPNAPTSSLSMVENGQKEGSEEN